VGANAQARIEGQNVVCNNTSLDAGGGGIAVVDQGQLAIVGGSVVCSNIGGVVGGGLVASHNTKVLVRNASIHGNVAHGSGGSIGNTWQQPCGCV
jgi:hypothetical protein